jgi:hypothetical protein
MVGSSLGIGAVGAVIVAFFCSGVPKSFAAQEKRGSLWNRVNLARESYLKSQHLNRCRGEENFASSNFACQIIVAK